MAESQKSTSSTTEVTVKTVQPADTEVNRDAYIGVDPIYQNYANDTDKPFTGEEEADLDTEQTKEAGDQETTASSEGAGSPSATQGHADQGSGDTGDNTTEESSSTPRKTRTSQK